MVRGQVGVLNRHTARMLFHRGRDGAYGDLLDMRNVVIPMGSERSVGLP